MDDPIVGFSLLQHTDFLMYGAMAMAAMFGLIVVVLVVRKLSLGRHGDPMAGLTYLDVAGMTKSGLLTEEEAARVREAMKKQVARQQAAAMRPPIPGELGLLSDPEVQRLEALAEARQKSGQSRKVPYTAAPPADGQSVRPSTSVEAPETAPSAETPAAPAGSTERLVFRPHTSPIPAPPPADDVPLPPDVVKMAELGLITAEELERIKERIRTRKQELTS